MTATHKTNSESTAPANASSMRRHKRIEAGLWIVTLMVPASIAITVYVDSPRNANESAAIHTLKRMSSAQSQFQATGKLDVDGNGQGEFGFFSDLMEEGLVSANEHLQMGVIRNSGYEFEMFLASASGAWISARTPNARSKVDPARSERAWICLAKPQQPGRSGICTYFLDHRGAVFAATPLDHSRAICFVPDLGAMRCRNGRWDNLIYRADVEGLAWSHRN